MRKNKMLMLSAFLLGLLVSATGWAENTSLQEGDWPVSTATFIGADQCKGCHTIIKGHYAHTKHALAFERNAKNELERKNCEACHGPGSVHAENPEERNSIINFQHDSDVSQAVANNQCLACHKGGERIHWDYLVHDRNQLFCSDCHNPMARFSRRGLLRKASANETCYSCHQNQKNDFRKRSHMPLLEGKLACIDCHNPHGSSTDSLLRADNINQVCYNCHQEKRGPFLFEHPPARENCMNCHMPHGSNYEFLLTTDRPFLCQQCHSHGTHVNDPRVASDSASGSNPTEFVVGRACQNCHAQIHGSNHPSGARMHR